jgi:hypothetical protein
MRHHLPLLGQARREFGHRHVTIRLHPADQHVVVRG